MPDHGDILVLGSGCRSCEALLENTQEAVRRTGSGLTVGYVTDVRAIAGFGVMRTPALVFGREVVSVGRVLSADEVAEIMGKHGLVGA
ncbi:MAG: thioredoxin family protein [Thermoplasmata archaeon]|nr:thioredoxin family protein [Thermoplasmata archaeon]